MGKFRLRDRIFVNEPFFAMSEPIPRYIGTRHYVAIVQDIWFTKNHIGWYTLTIITCDTNEFPPKSEIRRMQKNIDKRAQMYEGAK